MHIIWVRQRTAYRVLCVSASSSTFQGSARVAWNEADRNFLFLFKSQHKICFSESSVSHKYTTDQGSVLLIEIRFFTFLRGFFRSSWYGLRMDTNGVENDEGGEELVERTVHGQLVKRAAQRRRLGRLRRNVQRLRHLQSCLQIVPAPLVHLIRGNTTYLY